MASDDMAEEYAAAARSSEHEWTPELDLPECQSDAVRQDRLTPPRFGDDDRITSIERGSHLCQEPNADIKPGTVAGSVQRQLVVAIRVTPFGEAGRESWGYAKLTGINLNATWTSAPPQGMPPVVRPPFQDLHGTIVA